MSDTALAHPVITGTGQNDSIYVYIPQYIMGLGYSVHYIIAGDSIHLSDSNIGSDVQAAYYLWRPNHGLLDSTNASFWTKPDYNTGYYLIVTDIYGCTISSGLSCMVIVSTVNIGDVLVSDKFITLHPNPTTGTIFLKDEEKQVKNVQIFDATGRFVAEVLPLNFPYNLRYFAKGIYYLKIETEFGQEKKTVVLK